MGLGEWALKSGAGIVVLGEWGWESGAGRVGLGDWGWEIGAGRVGPGEWGRESGAGRVWWEWGAERWWMGEGVCKSGSARGRLGK